jgi:hypothetical protein
MALVPETGVGVPLADSYAAQATITAYWAARPHNALATTWSTASTGNRDGAAREATAYVDSVFGNYYRGVRRGYVQGLLFPRTDALDAVGYPLPDLPPELVAAVCELAARALSATLAADDTTGIKSETKKVGSIEKTVEYMEGGRRRTSYGFVADILAPILTGQQPYAPAASWAWA